MRRFPKAKKRQLLLLKTMLLISRNSFYLVLLLLPLLSLQCSRNKTINSTPIISNEVVEYKGDLAEGFDESVADFYSHLKMVMKNNELSQLKVKLTNNVNLVSSHVAGKIGKKRQPFYIKVDKKQILIYGAYSEGIRNGMYWYLQSLGFRWYFPGELWRKIPTDIENLKPIDKLVVPSFSDRSFSGGGGFPNKHPGDPNNIVRTEWTKWKHRNLFGEEEETGGHAWQDFVKRNKDVLFQHPEYLAKKLNPNKPSLTTKLCVGEEALVQLFIADRAKKIEETITRYGSDHLKSQSISVEPSDGGGFCQCRKCKRIGTISDQVFYLANRVAEALEKEYPTVKVSLLAYNEHSAVPSIDLHKNVAVTIVPYGFQHETMPEEFIGNWSKKTKNLKSYHYWGLLISRKGKPVEHFLERPAQEIKLLKKHNVAGIRVESTYSIGAAGIPLYLLSRLGFDASLDVNLLTNELLVDCFGRGAEVMRGIFTRWSNHDFIPQVEKIILKEEFAVASNLARTNKERQRVEAFKKYVTFLLFADDVESVKKNKVKLTPALDMLTEYSWSILPDLMIHSFWISSPFMRTYDRKRYNNNYRKKERERGSDYWLRLSTKKFPSPFKANSKGILVDKASSQTKQTNFSYLATKRSTKSSTILVKPTKSFTIDYYADRPHELPFSFSSKIINPKRIGSAFIIGLYEEDNLIWTKTFKGATKKGTEILRFPKEGNYTIKGKLPNVKVELNWKDTQRTFLKCGTPINVPAYYYQPEKTQEELLFVTKGKVTTYDEKGNIINLIQVDKNVYKIDLRRYATKEIKFVSSLVVDILNSKNCLFYLK